MFISSESNFLWYKTSPGAGMYRCSSSPMVEGIHKLSSQGKPEGCSLGYLYLKGSPIIYSLSSCLPKVASCQRVAGSCSKGSHAGRMPPN